MTLLFLMRHSGYVRNFESTLRLLCARGHRVHVGFQRTLRVPQLDPGDIAGQLAAACPTFSHSTMPSRTDGWGLAGRELRSSLDYLRSLRPEFDAAPKLRARVAREAPLRFVERLARGPWTRGPRRRLLAAWLRGLDRAVPRDPDIDARIAALSPDVVAVTPLIEAGAPQADYVRSARARGIPVALCVASWDNLTNKGLIHGPVDLVTVWNDAMKREAITLHGIDAGRIAVTGAAAFDHWFDWTPSTSREAFCARAGLRADRPYLLYLCSSRFIAPYEVPFVRRWLEHLRTTGTTALREAGVLVRPHPQNAAQWQDEDLSALGAVIWPRAGTAPVDDGSRSEYFDSMFHSAAVVGVNTTAEVESAIVGRRAHTVLSDDFRDTQEGTLHFRHLRGEDGSALRVARDFEEHLAHLDAALRDVDGGRAASARFVRTFVRPHGLDRPATPRLVDALEGLAGTRPARGGGAPFWAPLVRGRLAARGAELVREAEEAGRLRAAKRAAREARHAAGRTAGTVGSLAGEPRR